MLKRFAARLAVLGALACVLGLPLHAQRWHATVGVNPTYNNNFGGFGGGRHHGGGYGGHGFSGSFYGVPAVGPVYSYGYGYGYPVYAGPPGGIPVSSYFDADPYAAPVIPAFPVAIVAAADPRNLTPPTRVYTSPVRFERVAAPGDERVIGMGVPAWVQPQQEPLGDVARRYRAQRGIRQPTIIIHIER